MSGARNTRRNYEVTAKSRRRHYDGSVSGNCFPGSVIQPDESCHIKHLRRGLKERMMFLNGTGTLGQAVR